MGNFFSFRKPKWQELNVPPPSPKESPIKRNMSPSPDPNKAIGDYQIIDYIDEGTFGKVLLARYKLVPTPKYALKVISRSAFKETEIEILKALCGTPGVLQYVEHFNYKNKVIIVSEYYKGTDLFHYITEHNPLSEEKIKLIFKRLCTIMAKVHAKGIVHRDLKPENILINDQEEVLIIDWGFAFYPSKTRRRESCGTIHYASPEIISHPPLYKGPEVDVWSLGVILYAMATNSLPFDYGENIKGTFAAIRRCNPDYTQLGLTENIVTVLKKIFVRHRRSQLTEILCSSWLCDNPYCATKFHASPKSQNPIPISPPIERTWRTTCSG